MTKKGDSAHLLECMTIGKVETREEGVATVSSAIINMIRKKKRRLVYASGNQGEMEAGVSFLIYENWHAIANDSVTYVFSREFCCRDLVD